MRLLNILPDLLIRLPARIGAPLLWAGPLLARVVVGYTFMLTGWAKLNNLERITAYFTELGIPQPQLLTPMVAGWECVGGALLIAGLLTRISGGGLAVIMAVAILSAQASEIHSLGDLLGLEEATYFAVFTWLAIAGAGRASLDYFIERCSPSHQAQSHQASR